MKLAAAQGKRTSGLLPIAFAVALLALAPAAATAASPAPAASAAPAAPITAADRAHIEELIRTIEDPAARERLVDQLRSLAAAGPAAAPPSPAPIPEAAGLLGDLAQILQNASDELIETATAIANVGNVGDWLIGQIQDSNARDRWFRVLGRLVVVLVVGWLVEWLIDRALRAPCRYIDSRRPRGRWTRAPLGVARWLLDLVPIGAFAASAYAMLALPFYRPGGHSEVISVVAITAYAISRTATTLSTALFRPANATLRILPVGDENAARLHSGVRQPVLIVIWGYYADEGLRLLGMPEAGYQSLLKLLGLFVLVRLIALVVQYRRPVAAWIRSLGTGDPSRAAKGLGLDHRVAGLRNWIADVWHILAGLYLVAAYIVWALRVEGGFEFLLRASVVTAIILVAARLATGALERAVERAFARDEARHASDHRERRRRRYQPLARNLVRLIVAVLAILSILQTWGANTLGWFSSEAGQRVLGTAAYSIAVVVVAALIWETMSGAIERYLGRTDAEGQLVARSARARTLLPLLRNALTILIVLMVALIVLGQFGVDIAPLLAGAGVIGVAIGFGSQKLVQDVITGAFILFEDTMAVGDNVTIGTHTGTVEAMTIRTIRLRNANGELHTLPFSSVTTIINMSRGYATCAFNVSVAYREDIDRVIEVMRAIGEEIRADEKWGRWLIEPIEVFGVERLADSAVIVSGQFKTAPDQQPAISRELNRRIKKRFDELGISMPFPSQTVYFGEERAGGARPVHVRIEQAPGGEAKGA